VCPRDATPLADNRGAGTDPLIGQVLAGTYRIVRVLGEGGMARLYQADHVRLDRRYAIKVIHEELARSPDLLVRFEREARAAARIQSKHVVGVIDVIRTLDQRPCIVGELLEGEDLQARLDREKLTVLEAIPIARQICRALDVAHQRGVVHRDLKPSNVYLTHDDNGELLVKVLDFGVAKVVDERADLTRTGAVVGTPAYMAPEQARRASEAGPLADVYAVGALLYRMLTGEPPYGKDPPVSPFLLLLNEEPARPREIEPSLPEGIEAVIQHAMARDPAARPRGALELDAELAAFDVPRNEPTVPILAVEIARSARLARPLAVGLTAAAALGAGLWAAALIGALLAGRASWTGTEQALISLIGVTVTVAIAVVLGRALRARWRSAPAVAQVGRLLARMVLAGIATLGSLELLARGVGALLAPPGLPSMGWFVARLLLAGAAAGLAPWLVPRLPGGDDGRR
jgi:eukaryotic-like serine/threonine-protein kinase